MLSRIVGFSLRNRFLVLALASVLFLFGLYQVSRSPMDVFPEFAPPQVTVETEAPGLSSEEVESLVTLRLELSINGTPGLQTLRSISRPGVASITAIFADDTDVYRDRQLIAERIATVARDLPESVVAPEIVPLTSASSTIEVLGVTSNGPFDPIAVRTFADWTLKPRILSVPGISKVVTYGGRSAQYQVTIRADALRDFDLTLDDVENAARKATAISPAGSTEIQGQRLSIRSVSQATGPEDLKSSPVAFRDGTTIPLSRVADVRIGPEFPIGEATLNGQPAVVLLVARQPGVNTLRVTADLDAALDEISRHLPSGLRLNRNLFRQASFIERGLANLRRALLFGGILVALVLIVFLLDWRTAVISLAAIPLSLLAALVVLRASGATVNTMTLGGLAIALGEVVDDSIIDVENIHRRLRENRDREIPRPFRDVIFDASLEVRSAVVYATFLVALVFLPVFFLSGVAGKIFSPLAEAYVLATLASLAVALIVTPAASSVLLSRAGAGRSESSLAAGLKRLYAAVLPHSIIRPRLLAGCAAGLTLIAGGAILLLGGEFLPPFQEDDFIVHMVGLAGTSLSESVSAGKKVEARLLAIPGVVSVAQRAGRAELADEVSGPESSEIDVALSPKISAVSGKIGQIRAALDGFPGFAFGVNQFLKERIEEVAGGEAAPVAVSVYGPDLNRLDLAGREVAGIMASLPGARDIRLESAPKVPQVVIALDRARAAQLGATIQDLQATVTTALAGSRVGEIVNGQQITPIVVKYPDERRESIEAIRELPVRVKGALLPLRTLARVEVRDAPESINRQGGSRRVVVTCDSSGSVGRLTRSLEQRLRTMQLPPGFSVDVSGDYENQQRSIRELLLVGLAAMFGIFLLLFTDFRSARLATLVLVNLPLSFVGGIAAALILRITLSLGTVVGFVTLFGITARNAIMLLSHYRHLEETEGMEFGPALVISGSLDRLTPILMTALITGVALLPLVIGGNRAGQEIEHPMAVVIVGGLVSSTLLNLLLLPAFYLRWGKSSPSPMHSAE